MENEVFDCLMDIFNSANYRFLSHVEITHLLIRKGLYQGVEFPKAAADVWDHLNRPTAVYPFCWIEKSDETLWGLERWLPPKKRRSAGIVKQGREAIPLLDVGAEVQHIISVDAYEITSGTFPLRGHFADSFIASMDEKQREYSIVELHCYGSEKLICAVTHDERGNWILEGMTLQRWYKENGLQAGDKIWLVVESVNPLTMRAYTEWDRDLDTFRRYEQRRGIDNLPSIDLPIRDIIWMYFKRTQKIAHRTEITNAVLKERPEISERSVDACLGANPHLFTRAGEKGNWALREWGIEEVNIVILPKGSNIGTPEDQNLRISRVPIDYILANIAAEDLVHKILKGSKDSLSVSQITERIAEYLGVDKSILARTSFFNPSDMRLVRLQDGSFRLREDIEEYADQVDTVKQSLMNVPGQSNQEFNKSKDDVGTQTSQHKRNWPNERMANRCQKLFTVLADHPAPQ